MRTSLLIILSCLTMIGSEAIASFNLANPKVVLPASRIISPRRSPEFSARLSPDGKHILFPQQVKDKDETYRLVLFDIETNKETEVPVDFPRGYETVFTRFNFFSPKGDKLALFSMKQYPNPTVTEVVIYDIPSNKLTTTNITGHSTMAQFDSTGEKLVVSQHNSYVAVASIDDYSISKPLESGWVHSCNPYSPFSAVFQQPNPRQKQLGFKLLNLDSKKAVQLPVYEKNRKLDDVTSQWSLDGRYLFYVDVDLDSNRQPTLMIRVWDIKEAQEKAAVHNVICLGPGPTSNLMLMASTEEAYRGSIKLYDIESESLSAVGDISIKAVHAWGDNIIYVSTENGTESIYVADIIDVASNDNVN